MMISVSSRVRFSASGPGRICVSNPMSIRRNLFKNDEKMLALNGFRSLRSISIRILNKILSFSYGIGGPNNFSLVHDSIKNGKEDKKPSEIACGGLSEVRDIGRIVHINAGFAGGELGKGQDLEPFSLVRARKVFFPLHSVGFYRIPSRNTEKIPCLIARAFSCASCVVSGMQRSLVSDSPFSNRPQNPRPLSHALEKDSESDDENNEFIGGCSDDQKSHEVANLEEVERVCKVVEELFASDRNMEAVLNQIHIQISHALVSAVLFRFQHAWRPSFRFFCWAGQRSDFSHDSQTYNSMMNILGKTRQFESMVALLEEMGKKGFLTMDTFVIAIKAFAAAREMKKAIGIFELMKRYNMEADVETFNCLLDALARAKLGKEAQALFEKMKDRFTPDLRTYSVLLAGWCKLKNLIEAAKVWNEITDQGLIPDVVAHNIMLEGLCTGRRRSEGIKLLELMKSKGPSPNVRSYTILIRDLCKGNKMDLAIAYFDEMLAAGCKPDAAVYTCLIVGFGNQKKMDAVYGLLKEMKQKGCPPDARTYNALIKLMTNRNMPDDAARIYKTMIKSGFEPTIHTYNMMMKSYFRSKNYEMGHAVWEEMGKKGCCPDDNSYTVFISGLIIQGRPEEACKYIEEMINKGMKAPQLDYNKFVADFSRAGKPDILLELAQKMKFAGKFEVSNVFSRWAEMMKKRVKIHRPN